MLLATSFLDLVVRARIRTQTLRTRRQWEEDHAGNALGGICSELAQRPFADTLNLLL